MSILHSDPVSVVYFCQQIAMKCSEYEALNKSPQELVDDFIDEVYLSHPSFTRSNINEVRIFSSYGEAINYILKIYFCDEDDIRRLN